MAVTVLAEAFRQQATVMTFRAFDVGTVDIPIEVVEQACMRAITACKFMPSVFELRQLAGCDSVSVTNQDRSSVAWMEIKAAVANVGGYSTVSFSDPIVNATIRGMGGWERFCECESGEQFDVWLRKEFESLYGSLLRTGVAAEQTTPLPGLCDKSNSATGHEQRTPVANITVALPEVPKRLIRGEVPKPVTRPRLAVVENLVDSLELPEEPPKLIPPKKSREEQIAELKAAFNVNDSEPVEKSKLDFTKASDN